MFVHGVLVGQAVPNFLKCNVRLLSNFLSEAVRNRPMHTCQQEVSLHYFPLQASRRTIKLVLAPLPPLACKLAEALRFFGVGEGALNVLLQGENERVVAAMASGVECLGGGE